MATQEQLDIISKAKARKYVINDATGTGTYMDANEVAKWKDGKQATDTGGVGFRLASLDEEKGFLNESGQEADKAHNIKLPNVTKENTIPVNTSVTQPTTASLKDQIVNTQKQNAVDRFKTAFEQSKGRLAQEEAAVAPEFRKKESLIGVQDTMSRTAADKSRAIGGLSAAGAKGQDEMAQNVITQGSLGASREQEQTIRADIQRRLSEAQLLRDQGIATAESEADITTMQNKLYELDALAAKQDAAELTSKAEAEAKDAQIKSDYLNTIGRFYGDYQAEINRVKNDGDPTNDWQIPILESARQSKIANEGLDQQGKPIAVDNTAELSQATYDRALEKWKYGLPLTQDEMTALNVTTPVKPVETTSSYNGGTDTTAPTFTDVDTLANYNMLKSRVKQIMGNDAVKIQWLQSLGQDLYTKYGKDAVSMVLNDLTPATTTTTPTEYEYDQQSIIDMFSNIGQKSNTYEVNGIPVYQPSSYSKAEKEQVSNMIQLLGDQGKLSVEDADALAIYFELEE